MKYSIALLITFCFFTEHGNAQNDSLVAKEPKAVEWYFIIK
jgi:hypothetical protein